MTTIRRLTAAGLAAVALMTVAALAQSSVRERSLAFVADGGVFLGSNSSAEFVVLFADNPIWRACL